MADDTNTFTKSVSEIRQNANYDSSTNANDISVLVLDSSQLIQISSLPVFLMSAQTQTLLVARLLCLDGAPLGPDYT